MGVRRYFLRAVYTVPWHRRVKRKLLLGAILSIATIWYLVIHAKGSVVELSMEVAQTEDLYPFQPEVVVDFPTLYSTVPKIPHILHQHFQSKTIPANFVENVKSCVHLNPQWTYYFWTEAAARDLVKERLPYLLKTWDNYESSDDRADVLRYIVLYEFGGVFIDMDFECLRSLDRVTMKYSCIFPPEPFQKSVFGNHAPYSLTNSIILCRPKHPFLKQILESLPLSRVFIERIDATGPSLVSMNFLIYNNISDIHESNSRFESNSPYFYKGNLPETDLNAVYVPNTVYFFDTLDDNLMPQQRWIEVCNEFENLDQLQKKACLHAYNRALPRKENNYAYTRQNKYSSSGYGPVELSAIVPYYISYGAI